MQFSVKMLSFAVWSRQVIKIEKKELRHDLFPGDIKTDSQLLVIIPFSSIYFWSAKCFYIFSQKKEGM